MNIGLFFGTFNPVHIGHIAIAGYMAEFTDLNQVWFVVSPHNPLKEKKFLLSDAQRVRLVKMAIYGQHKKLKVSDVELKLSQPSYTVNTLAFLKNKFRQHTFSIIIGHDNLESFPLWKNYKEILDNHRVFVYPRTSSFKGTLIKHRNIVFTDAPLMEISSTFIRKAIRDKKDVGFLLPAGIGEIIRKEKYYKV